MSTMEDVEDRGAMASQLTGAHVSLLFMARGGSVCVNGFTSLDGNSTVTVTFHVQIL